MSDARQELLTSFADRYRAAAPDGWLRIVTWWIKLGDSAAEASLSGAAHVDVVIIKDGDGSLRQESVRPASPPIQDLLALQPLQAGTHEEGWTGLHVEIDRDASTPRAEFVHGTPLSTESSYDDPWADGVRNYLELHRDELGQLGGLGEEPERRGWNPFRR